MNDDFDLNYIREDPNFELALQLAISAGTEQHSKGTICSPAMDRDDSAGSWPASSRVLPPLPSVSTLHAVVFLMQPQRQAPIKNTRSGTAVIFNHAVTCALLSTNHHTTSDYYPIHTSNCVSVRRHVDIGRT